MAERVRHPEAVPDWREALVRKHPDLFGLGRSAEPADLRSYPTVGDGWRDLVETAVARIAAAVAGAPGGRLTITFIREKLASLRLDYDAELPEDVLARVDEAVALAEARSGCTCEVCGAPGQVYDDAGWYSLLCEVHARGERAWVRPGYENLYVERTVVDGHLRVSRCRRYDRRRDAFEDVPLPPDWEDE